MLLGIWSNLRHRLALGSQSAKNAQQKSRHRLQRSETRLVRPQSAIEALEQRDLLTVLVQLGVAGFGSDTGPTPADLLEQSAGTVDGVVARQAGDLNADWIVTLSSSSPADVVVPATVTIPAGQYVTHFTVQIVNDSRLDGRQIVTITANALDVLSNETGSDNVAVPIVDDESFTSSAVAASVPMGTAAQLRIDLAPGPLAEDAVFQLQSTSSELQAPATVTIPAGQAFGIFDLPTVDDGIPQGTHGAAAIVQGPGTQGPQVVGFALVEPTPVSISPSAMGTMSAQEGAATGTYVAQFRVTKSGTVNNFAEAEFPTAAFAGQQINSAALQLNWSNTVLQAATATLEVYARSSRGELEPTTDTPMRVFLGEFTITATPYSGQAIVPLDPVALESVLSNSGFLGLEIRAAADEFTSSTLATYFTNAVLKVGLGAITRPSVDPQTLVVPSSPANGTLIGSIAATDPNNSTLTFAILSGNSDGALTLDAATGALSVGDVVLLTATARREVRVEVTNAAGARSQAVVTIDTVGNELPSINSQSFSVIEHLPVGTVFGTLAANDPTGQTLTYSMIDGSYYGGFAIDPVTGELSIADSVAVNYELVPQRYLTVAVTDSQGGVDYAFVNVSIQNVNEAPVAQNKTFAAYENSSTGSVLRPNGVSVTSVTAIDPDANDTKTWTILSGNTNNAFAIDNSGNITVANQTALNFEVTPTFNLLLQVTDSGGLTGTCTLTIDLVNVNEAPSLAPASFSIVENSVNGTVVGTLAGSDPDSGDTKTFLINSGNTNSAFAISNTGVLTVNNSAALNYETQQTFNLSVRLRDAAGLYSDAAVTVTVTNVNEAPVITPVTFTRTENLANGTTIGTISAVDPEGQSRTLSILSGNTSSAFALNSSTGVLTVSNAAALNYEVNPTFALTVQATDASGLSSTAVITINLTNVNEAPTASGFSLGMSEDTIKTGTLTGSDPEGLPITFQAVTQPLYGSLVLQSNGSYTYTPFANFAGSDNFRFRTFDGTLYSAETQANFTISNINDVPVANNDVLQVTEDQTLQVRAGGVSRLNMTSQPGDYIGQGQTYNYTSSTGTFTAGYNYSAQPYSGIKIYYDDIGTPYWYLQFDASNNQLLSTGTYTGATQFLSNGTAAGLDVWGNGRSSSSVAGEFTVRQLMMHPGGQVRRFAADFVQRANGSAAALTGTVEFNYDANNTISSLLDNDVDVDFTSVYAVVVSGPSHGMLTLSTNGELTYVPAPNYFGTDSFTYRLNDGSALSAPATVTINVTNVNDAPSATASNVSTNEDTPLSGSVSGTDLDGDTLTYSLVSGPSNGSLIFNADGTFIYTPNANFQSTDIVTHDASDSFYFKVNDGALNSTPAKVKISVVSVNDAPIGNSASFSVSEDQVVGGILTGSDVENSALTFTLADSPAHGTVMLSANGAFNYIPAANYNGSDSFTFVVNDGSLTSAPTTVSLNFAAVNDAPTADATSFTSNEDVVLNGTLTGSDIEASPLTFAVGDGPTNGTLVLNENGTFSYVPNVNFNGGDSFTFTVNDGELSSSASTVSLFINPINDAPTAAVATFNGTEDTTLNGALSGSDIEASPLTYSLVTTPTNGSVTLNSDGTFSYIPNANFNGSDSFTFKVNDGSLNSTAATVTLNIAAVNDAPVANAASFNGTEDAALNGSLTGSDVEGVMLSYSVVSGPANGSLTLNSNGTFSFVPNANFNGTDSFTFRVNDGSLNSTAATVALNIAAMNDAPTANAASFNGTEDTTLNGALAGSDIEGSALSYSVVTSPANGTLTLNADGTFSYMPNANFNGTDSVTFRVNDGSLNSTAATVTLNITAVNDAPTANGASFNGTEDTTLNGTLTGSDIEGSALSYSVVTSPANGTLTLNADGTFSYMPNANFNGTDSVTFRVNDGSLNSTPATVALNIAAVNDAPTANGASFNGTEDATLNGTLTGFDVEGANLSFSVVSSPANGALTLNSNGTFSFVPNANFNGSDSFTFRVNDGSLNSTPATVAVNIAAVNDAPALSPATFSLPENSINGTTVGTVTVVDVDAGDSKTLMILSGNTNGAFAIANTGVITVANSAALDFETTPTFTLSVRATDAAGASSTANITINLTDVVEAAPTKFFTVDAGTDSAYRYAAAGTALTSSTLNVGNTNSVGVAADITGTKYWVIDSNKNVYVYNATTGALLGSWAAGGLTTPQGITTDGTSIWIVDSGSDKVFKYDNAASRLSGSQTANSNWALNNGNKNSTDLVTNGTSIWTLQSASTDKVFKYSMTGTLQGSWTISATNATPTGLTIDPANVSDIWIVDSGTDRVYQYAAAATRTSGSQAFATSWALAAANTNPQGIADPPPPSADSSDAETTPVRIATSDDHDFVTTGRQQLLVEPGQSAATRNSEEEVPSVGPADTEAASKRHEDQPDADAKDSANDAAIVAELFASEHWLMRR